MIWLAAFLTGVGNRAFSTSPPNLAQIRSCLPSQSHILGHNNLFFSVTSPLAPLTPHQLDVVADLGDLVRHISTKRKISIMSEDTR